MKWEEIEKDKVWKAEQYKIRKGVRFRQSAIVPDSVRALGPHIYHCYDENGIYIYQASALEEAKKRIEKIASKK